MNRVANAISQKVALLTTMQAKVTCFESLKDHCKKDPNFGHIWYKLSVHEQTSDYHIHEGIMFKDLLVCIPQGSFRLELIYDLHFRGLEAHTGTSKTIALLEENVLLASPQERCYTICAKMWHLPNCQRYIL